MADRHVLPSFTEFLRRVNEIDFPVKLPSRRSHLLPPGAKAVLNAWIRQNPDQRPGPRAQMTLMKETGLSNEQVHRYVYNNRPGPRRRRRQERKRKKELRNAERVNGMVNEAGIRK